MEDFIKDFISYLVTIMRFFLKELIKVWSSELLLKPRLENKFTPDSDSLYLNDVYSGNSGTFFFMGTRAENKYYHPASGSPLSDTGYTRVTSGVD